MGMMELSCLTVRLIYDVPVRNCNLDLRRLFHVCAMRYLERGLEVASGARTIIRIQRGVGRSGSKEHCEQSELLEVHDRKMGGYCRQRERSIGNRGKCKSCLFVVYY